MHSFILHISVGVHYSYRYKKNMQKTHNTTLHESMVANILLSHKFNVKNDSRTYRALSLVNKVTSYKLSILAILNTTCRRHLKTI